MCCYSVITDERQRAERRTDLKVGHYDCQSDWLTWTSCLLRSKPCARPTAWVTVPSKRSELRSEPQCYKGFYGLTCSAEVLVLSVDRAQLATHFDAKNSISAFLCGILIIAS